MRIMKFRRLRQERLNREFYTIFILNFIVIFILLFTVMFEVSGNNKIEDEELKVYESTDHNTVTSSANTSSKVFTALESEITGRNLTEDDKYLLAKIAMAEAEGESLETKILVILTVINRVESDKFPDSIKEVIFQERRGIYQFSPVMPNGRWWKVEPNEECWEAIEIVDILDYDMSEGALYFESCIGESWHSKNLEFICEVDNTRFYK